MILRAAHRSVRRRIGAAAVEFAVVLPVFLTFVFGVIEVSRIRLTSNLLKTACRTAARYGAAEGVSSAQACERVRAILSTALNAQAVSVVVKDASVYDTGGELPDNPEDYDALPNIELDQAQPRQLFLIRATVGYNRVALIPFACLSGVSFTGQAFMRHE